MKRMLDRVWLLLVAFSIIVPTSHASMLFVTDLVNGPSTALPIPGNQDFSGQLGDDFTVSEPAGIAISRVGVFDSNGDGTTVALIWRLFDVTSGALVQEETVAPTGVRLPGASTITSNYVFESVTPFTIGPGSYSAVAYGFNGSNLNFNTNFDLANLDVVFSSIGIIGAGGRYSSGTSATLPTDVVGNVLSVNPYNFGAATFEFNIPGPTGIFEPASSSIVGLALAAIYTAKRRRQH